ncbi:unnamed protein product, partial [Pleuronectes platessa]
MLGHGATTGLLSAYMCGQTGYHMAACLEQASRTQSSRTVKSGGQYKERYPPRLQLSFTTLQGGEAAGFSYCIGEREKPRCSSFFSVRNPTTEVSFNKQQMLNAHRTAKNSARSVAPPPARALAQRDTLLRDQRFSFFIRAEAASWFVPM